MSLQTAILLVIPLVIGCSTHVEPDRVLHFGRQGQFTRTYSSENMSTAERAALPRIAERFNRFIQSGAGILTFIEVDKSEIPTNPCLTLSPTTLGCESTIHDEEITIKASYIKNYYEGIFPEPTIAFFEAVMLHELCHAFGLQHLATSQGLMTPSLDEFGLDFNDADFAECQAANTRNKGVWKICERTEK